MWFEVFSRFCLEWVVVGLGAHFCLIEEDDVASEVFRIFHVIVSFHFVSAVGFVDFWVGEFIGSVSSVDGLSEVSSELLVLIRRLFRIRYVSVGRCYRIPVVTVSGWVSHFATDLRYQFGVLFRLVFLCLCGLGCSLRVWVRGHALVFFSKWFSAFWPFVSVYAAVTTWSVEFPLGFSVLLRLRIGGLRYDCGWLRYAHLVEWLHTGCGWKKLCVLISTLHECSNFFHWGVVLACHC